MRLKSFIKEKDAYAEDNEEEQEMIARERFRTPDSRPLKPPGAKRKVIDLNGWLLNLIK